MTKEEIEKLPNIITMLLSESVLVDTKEKTHEKITEVCNLAIKALEQEPRKGHWIETAEEYYKAINEKGGGVNENTDFFTDDIACSECLAKFSVIDNEAERFDFCPNCGADMRGNARRKGEPIEGNNESYNCENWIP